MTLIAIDNGHGKNTAGKRTPVFPSTNTLVHEWEFNYPTAKKLGELLEYNGFRILYTSDTEKDTPLKTRTDRANEANADLLISIHYNAFQSVWGTHGGIETYHYPSSNNGKKLAELVQEELIRETGLRNRGVKSANFQILRETKMPSILCECGFMDNLEEAQLMLDEEYQWKCARAMAKGICKYFNVEYKEYKVEVKKLYRVQVGAYSKKENAENMLKELEKAGFKGFITTEKVEEVEKPIKKKSKYYKIGDAHIIETTPDNIKIEVLGNTLHNSGQYGINGTFFDTKTAPVDNPNSCVFIAMNNGKPVSSNAQFNGYNAPPRATMIYHTNGKMGFRKLQNINSIRGITQWAIGGYMVKPYMDFKNEKMPGSINYKTAHTYIGYDEEGNIYLIVKPNHMIYEIVPLLNDLGITNAIVLDGGGSSQLNHPNGNFRSSRKINTAILLKEV